MNEEIFLKSLKIVCDEITKNKTTISSSDFNIVKLYIKNTGHLKIKRPYPIPNIKI